MFCGPLVEALFSTNAGSVAFIRTSYSNEYRYKSPEERQRNIGVPTLERAQEFLTSSCLQPAAPSCCSLLQPMPDIRECGIGLQLYFSSLKYFGFVFLVMAIISVGQLTQNYDNNYYGKQNTDLYAHLGGSMGGVDGFQSTNLAQECKRMLTDPEILISNTTLGNLTETFDNMQQAKAIEVAFDAGYTLILLVSILIYAVRTRRIVENQRKKHPTLADFSLKFTQLPEARIPRLVHILEQNGMRVHDVVPIRHINKLIHQIKYIKQFYKSTFLQMLSDNDKKCTFYDFVEALEKRDRLEGEVKQEESMEVGHSAIIVFESREDRHRAIDCFYKGFLSSIFVKLSVWWKKMCHREAEREANWLKEINVKAVPTPEDIYWENIRKKRWMQRIKLYLLASFIIIFSIGIIFSLKILQKTISLHTKEECIENNKREYCDCILCNRNCESYRNESAQVGTVQVCIGFAITFVNSLLPWALGKITINEKQSSKPRRKLSAMMKIFCALLINTSFVILVVNANFQSFKVNYMLRLADKGYTDFNREWFAEVGFSIMVSMICSIFMPHCLMCAYYVIKKKCMRNMISFFDTQLAYNNWVIGSDIDLPLKTAMQLVVIFSCFIYAGGMPLMLIICSAAMFSIFTCEKYMLKYYEKPNERSTILHTWFVRLLPGAIVMHCLFSLYMYGSDIFPQMSPGDYIDYGYARVIDKPNQIENFKLENYTQKATNNYEARVKDYPGVVFLVLLSLAVLLPIITPKLARCIGRTRHAEEISHVLNDVNFFGGKSYQIAENNHYREVVKTMYEVGGCPDEESDVESPPPEFLPKLLQDSGSNIERNYSELEMRLTDQDISEREEEFKKF